MLKHCIHSLQLGFFIILHIKFSVVGQSVKDNVSKDKMTEAQYAEQTKCRTD